MNTNKRPVLNMEKLHKAVDDESYYSGGWPHVTKALEVLESHGILTYEDIPAAPAPAPAPAQALASFMVPGYRWIQKEGNLGFWSIVMRKP